MAVVAKEVQELLLEWEEELTRREEALATQEGRQGFWRMRSPRSMPTSTPSRPRMRLLEKGTLMRWQLTAHAKHSLGLDEMLGEKVELDGREWDLNMCEVALVEA
jgi:hypothetical protein